MIPTMEKKSQTPKVSTASTKQQMLDAYNELLKQVQEKRESELKPETEMEEKMMTEAVVIADSLSTEGIVKEVGNLKSEIGKLLGQLSDRLEEEVNKYRQVRKAIDVKEREVQEIYGIQKASSSLAALIEAQQQKRQEFEKEMAERKETLERDATELKKREREKEEYLYAFQREQQLAKDQFQDQKTKLEKEIQQKKEQMEKELAERTKAIAQKEVEFAELQRKASNFPKELELTVSKAVKEAVGKVQLEAKNKEDLMKKEFDGERNVLNTRITSLEKTVKEQNDQIARLSQQFEKAYNQVQEIAVKSIEGSSNAKAFASLQQLVTEQARKQGQEK